MTIVVKRKDGEEFVASQVSDEGYWPVGDDGSLFLIRNEDVREAHILTQTKDGWKSTELSHDS